ncbi:Uma2 family endonuclease [Chondromyces apiculatus]|nr:Uma2 family endonuclease [Chondromyces apiculatus]
MRSRATAEVLRPTPMTLEAWAGLDEDEPGELADGHLAEEEVPSNLHELVVAWLLRVLGTWAAPRRYVVFGSEHKLAISATRGRKADVCMYPPGTRLGARAALSRTPPVVVIEVLSPRARDVRHDRMEKLGDYARFRVQCYWLLDPEARLLEVLELADDGIYRHVLSAGEEQVNLARFEGLTLDLQALWSEVDTLLTDEEEGPESEEG